MTQSTGRGLVVPSQGHEASSSSRASPSTFHKFPLLFCCFSGSFPSLFLISRLVFPLTDGWPGAPPWRDEFGANSSQAGLGVPAPTLHTHTYCTGWGSHGDGSGGWSATSCLYLPHEICHLTSSPCPVAEEERVGHTFVQ